MGHFLDLGANFWNIGMPDIGDSLAGVEAEKMGRWQNPSGEILVEEINASLDLICKSIGQSIFVPAEILTVTNELPLKSNSDLVKTVIADALDRCEKQRFLICIFCSRRIWYFAILDAMEMVIYWGQPEGITHIEPEQLAMLRLHLAFERRRRFGTRPLLAYEIRLLEMPRLNIPTDGGVVIFCIGAILKFFDRPDFAGNPMQDLHSIHNSILRLQILSALCRQSWMPIHAQKEAEPEPEPVPIILPAMTLNITMQDVPDSTPMELPFDFDLGPQKPKIESNIPDFVHLKNAVHWEPIFNPRTNITATVVQAVAYLTANGTRCSRDTLFAYLSADHGIELHEALPKYMELFYLPGNVGFVPLDKQALFENSRGLHLTPYGFYRYIQGVTGLLEADGKPFNTFHRNRGRRPVINKSSKSNVRRATWIGVVNIALKTARRPLTIEEITRFVINHTEIPINSEFREPDAFGNYTKLKAALNQGAREGSKCSSQLAGAVETRAIRPANFYKIETTKVQRWGLLENGERLYENRIPEDTTQGSLEWYCYDPNEPLCEAWILTLARQEHVFQCRGRGVYTSIEIARNALIEGPSDPNDTTWILKRARMGTNISLFNYGGKLFGLTHCAFPADSELNVSASF